MRWMYQACRAIRQLQPTSGRLGPRALLLITLAAVLGATGCASTPTTTPAAHSPPDAGLRFVLDGNFIAAKSAHDLRYTLLALGARDGHIAWRHSLKKQSPADSPGADYQPVFQDGRVYVGYYYDHADDPQHVVRYSVVETLEAKTGRLLWRCEVGVGAEFTGELVVDGSTLYASLVAEQPQGQQAPAESGRLVALDASTGSVRWQRALKDAPSMAASANGRVFVMTSQQSSGHLLALDAGNGSVAWDYTADAPLSRGGDVENGHSSAPLVVGGRVYAQAAERNADGSAMLKLLALNAGDGSLAWQHPTGGIAATPAFNQSGDTLCLSMYNPPEDTSTIIGLAASSGATRWSITGLQGAVSGCGASGDTFYLAQRSSDRQSGSVFALNSQERRQLWKNPIGTPVAADGLIAPAASNGVVGVYLMEPVSTSGSQMATLAVLRASDGRTLWQHGIGMRPGQGVDIEGDLIFSPEVSGGQPGITAYARDSGAILWSYPLGHL